MYFFSFLLTTRDLPVTLDDFRAVVLYASNYVVMVIGFMEQLEQPRISGEKTVRRPVHVLARELITRENNIIERIIGQESETPLSAEPTGSLITGLFHVNVLHDINYLGGWPIGRIQREPLFTLSSFVLLFLFQFYSAFFLTTRFNPIIVDRGQGFDRDFQPTGKIFSIVRVIVCAKLNACFYKMKGI